MSETFFQERARESAVRLSKHAQAEDDKLLLEYIKVLDMEDSSYRGGRGIGLVGVGCLGITALSAIGGIGYFIVTNIK